MEKLFSFTAVLWFSALFIPGFISVKVYGIAVASERPDFSKSFYDAVAYSVLNFAVFLPFLYWFQTEGWLSSPWVFGGVVYTVMLIAPIVWPLLYLRLCGLGVFPRSAQPTPWDDLFSRKPEVWVVAHMKNGKTVGGLYSTEDAAASSYPTPQQLLLNEAWEMGADGKPLKPIPRSKGVLFSMSEVESLEFYE